MRQIQFHRKQEQTHTIPMKSGSIYVETVLKKVLKHVIINFREHSRSLATQINKFATSFAKV